jgi:hypothetical protein
MKKNLRETIKKFPQTKSILKWEWRQKVDNIAIGMIIASVMILAIYFLLVFLL